ncbi:hypothetical protein HGB13_03880, partial [bacterium]|nr:hypothetical protein [bacterium]
LAITQNLAIDNAKKTSDVDLLIITSKNKIFIARFCVNIFLDIFGLRKVKNKNRICPNFFISEDSLDTSKVAIKDDTYLAFWVSSLRPIYNQKLFNKFKNENKWANKYFPNSEYKSNITLFNTPILFY